MNVNKEMMFGVLLVLMFGPDTGPLLLLFPQKSTGCTGHKLVVASVSLLAPVRNYSGLLTA